MLETEKHTGKYSYGKRQFPVSRLSNDAYFVRAGSFLAENLESVQKNKKNDS